MRRDMLEALPPDVADLLRSERLSPVPGPSERAAIWSRVEAATGVGGVAGGLASGLGPAKIGLLAATFVLGAAGTYWAFSRRVEPAHAPGVVAAAPAPPSLEPTPPPEPAPSFVSPPQRPTSPPAIAARPARPRAAPVETLGAEGALVGAARTALASDDVGGAIRSLGRHAREFPRGQLAQEREALTVVALVRSGAVDAARARAGRFLARHPRSIQRGVVEAALASIP